MSGFTNYLEHAVLNHVFGGVTYVSPPNVYLALFTSTPSDAGGGQEVSDGGYTRKLITFGAASNGTVANTNILSFLATGGDFGTVVATGLFDAPSGGNLLTWSAITPATINDLDTLSFAIGAVTTTLD